MRQAEGASRGQADPGVGIRESPMRTTGGENPGIAPQLIEQAVASLGASNERQPYRARSVIFPSDRQVRMSKDMWSPAEVAEYLGMTTNTVYVLLGQSAIPGQLRLGRRWRISRIAFLRSVHGEADLSDLGWD
jgi:excisionase family DNA binding protein